MLQPLAEQPQASQSSSKNENFSKEDNFGTLVEKLDKLSTS
jgi:hypothetical protein